MKKCCERDHNSDGNCDRHNNKHNNLFKNVKVLPVTCKGVGYYIRPADRSIWDVDNVRIECRGCIDCKRK